ncbi:MAG: hypothetical protein DI537_10130 [Stutzerimonas stutzeri]|nr:MAG: hypothetical protein DI537_10130 [Stutzerimonas stutzeri]
MSATAAAATAEHPAIKFSQTKEIVAAAAACAHQCGSRPDSSCRCLARAQAIYRLFELEVPDLGSLEDGEVLGLCSSGMLVQWNRDEQRCYASETIEQFGAGNLREEELARLHMPIALFAAAE